MKKLYSTIFAATILILSMTGCASPPESVSSSELPSSSETSFAEVSEVPSSDIISSDESRAEVESSEPVSSIEVSSKPAESSKPVESKEPVSSKETVSAKQTSSQAPVSSQCPVSSEMPPPVTSATPAPSSELGEYPENERPMTYEEVEALVEDAQQYASDKGMTLKTSYSVANGNGYDPPASSDFGYDSCKYYVYANIDAVYELNINSNFYYEGSEILYNIEVGELDGMPGYAVYVLY